MPLVSIIVPCYNEEATISLLLEAIYKQTYPLQEIEVVIADGMSNDRTREKIEEFQRDHPAPEVRIVDNTKRNIPSGLNRALENAQGEYIIRLDAHSIPAIDYVGRCVQALDDGRGDNVGGVWEINPGGIGWIARAIAIGAAHPLGVGDARYRIGGDAQTVDTVPFGAFKRDLFERIGLFDETLHTNEDYEFNVRLRLAGGRVWLDPAIRSTYFARTTLSALAKQYWRYGFWKAQMLKRYPSTIRWRQALPPAFVVSLLGGAILAMWLPITRWVVMFELILYSLVLLGTGVHSSIKHHDPGLIPGIPLSIATMHLSWGTALVWGLFKPITRPRSR